MHSGFALKVTADLFWTGLLVCLPVLGLTMLVGLLVSIFQVVTQIQEITLSFVPKLVGVGIVILVSGHWMLDQAIDFTNELFASLPQLLAG